MRECTWCSGSGTIFAQKLDELTDNEYLTATVLMNNGLTFSMIEVAFSNVCFNHKVYPIAYEIPCNTCEGTGKIASCSVREGGSVAQRA